MRALNILLVEDNEGDVVMTKRALRSFKPACTLSIAHDGLNALDMLRGEEPTSPQLILLDINMPRMDGKELLSVLKNDDGLRKIPVVMFTSSESPNDVRECYERLASCYVVKPFDGAEYAERLREVVTFWGTVIKLPN